MSEVRFKKKASGVAGGFFNIKMANANQTFIDTEFMKIQINDHRKIFAIQKEFKSLFPRLKIEFLGKPNKTGSSASTKIYNASKTIGDCRIKHTPGELTITPTMTAADLKQILGDKYGLTIALFRQTGSQWVETTNNNKLSLQEQNEENSL